MVLIFLWASTMAITDRTDEMAISAKDMILRPEHIYNFSGTITVRPNINQFGFCESFSPPFVVHPFQALWKLDNQSIPVLDYTWSPSGTLLTGTVEKGVSASMQILPLAGERAWVCKLNLENKGRVPLRKTLVFEMEGKVGATMQWGWVPPFVEDSNAAVSVIEEAMVLTSQEAQLAAVFQPSPASFNTSNAACFETDLPVGARHQILILVTFGKPEETIQTAKALLDQVDKKMIEAERQWDHQWKTLQNRLPRLLTNEDKLRRFYQCCLLTFLTTQWDLEGLVFRPWYAESGIDGGAVCNYLWGNAYLSKFLPLADPAATRALLMTSMKADYSSHYAMDPLSGRGLGVGYSYNYYSMALLVYDYIAITGDNGLLGESIRGKSFLDALYEYVFEREDMAAPPELIDYGINDNLLELRRTSAYQHYTPSPNLERLLSYGMMDRLFRAAGRRPPVDFEKRSRLLKQVILNRLWDEDLQWLRCLDQEHRPQVCWSIQVFDALRADLLSPRQASGLVGHLNDKEFLSDWGVHSLSKLDPGYDLSDVDWGGPGVYAGDAPQLVEDLLGAGFTDQGIGLVKRIVWWGELPYIPQAVRADRRDYRHDGRANVIAALAGPQAIVWGLFGIRADLKKVTINPVEHSYVAGMEVENLRIRGRAIRIAIEPDGRHYSVEADGQVLRNRIGDATVLKFK